MSLQSLITEIDGEDLPAGVRERLKRRVQAAYWIGAHDTLNHVPPPREAERRAEPRCSRAGRHSDIPPGYACIECEWENN